MRIIKTYSGKIQWQILNLKENLLQEKTYLNLDDKQNAQKETYTSASQIMKDFNPKNWLRLIRNLENYTPDEIETIHLIYCVCSNFVQQINQFELVEPLYKNKKLKLRFCNDN